MAAAPLGLRDLVAQRTPLIVPSMYDGISALLVREFGFEAAYIGSYGTVATRYGLPDIGFIGLEDMADQVRRLAPIADVPIIVDGENGFGNPIHVANTVRVLERAGAAATHIEDHLFGKHLDGQRAIPIADAVDKIKAAVDARDSADFMIIARSDAAPSEGIDAMIDRLLAYEEAGADGLFVGTLSIDEAVPPRLAAEASVPIFAGNDVTRTAAEFADRGASVVMYFALAHFTAEAGMRSAFEELATEHSTLQTDAGLRSYREFDRLLGIERYKEAARAYGLVPLTDSPNTDWVFQ